MPKHYKDSNKIRILFYLTEYQKPYSTIFNDYIVSKIPIISNTALTHPKNGINGITLFISRRLQKHEFIYIIKKVYYYFIKGSNDMIFSYKDADNSENNFEYIINVKNKNL